MTDRLFTVSNQQLLRRICGEYLEMPGLRLTAAQAQRLWDLDEPTCSQLLQLLVESKFLTRTVDGKYVRLTEGAPSSLPLRMAKAGFDFDSTVSVWARQKPPAV